MRLVMFSDGSGRRPGVVRGTDVVDLVEAARAIGAQPPAQDLLGLIEAGPSVLANLSKLVQSASGRAVRHLDDVHLHAPLDPPRGNVLAIGRNYQKHAAESARAWGEDIRPPTVFTKAQTAITGPYDDIRIDPRVSEQIDWEVELGVVVGKAGINIQPAEARSHVFGYTVVNDVSARDIQNGWGGQFFKGKSLDASSPVGPWIVTADEVPDPQKLRVILRVDGEIMQDGNTADMIYPVDELIAWLSKGMTLLPGALIATGTPEGVGFARTPPQFLKADNVMETEVERIGVLRNRFVAAPAAAVRQHEPKKIDSPA